MVGHWHRLPSGVVDAPIPVDLQGKAASDPGQPNVAVVPLLTAGQLD